MAELREIDVTGLEEGSKKLIMVDGKPIALLRVGGEYFAIEDTCTHAEASLSEGFLDGHEIECPLHGARFDIRTGDALAMPAFEGVKNFPVHTKDGKVFIEI